MAAKETSLLTQAQKDVLAKIDKVAGFGIKGITLTKAAYQNFLTICSKATKYPNFVDYRDINPKEKTYRGICVRAPSDKRRKYSEGNQNVMHID